MDLYERFFIMTEWTWTTAPRALGLLASVDARSAILLLIGLAKNWYLSIICKPLNPLLLSSDIFSWNGGRLFLFKFTALDSFHMLLLHLKPVMRWEKRNFKLVKESLSSYLVRPYLIRLLELLGNPLFLALYTFFSLVKGVRGVNDPPSSLVDDLFPPALSLCSTYN